jgi:hypothetical protein
MATATTSKNQTEATTERIRDLNERILDAGKQAGGAYLDAYERTLESIADYQENVAKQTDVEWISTVVDAQARFTRELTKLYVSTGRELLKKSPRRRAQRAVQPRSMVTGAPVKARPSGPSRNDTTPATSAGSISRLTACGWRITSSRTRSSGSPCARA